LKEPSAGVLPTEKNTKLFLSFEVEKTNLPELIVEVEWIASRNRAINQQENVWVSARAREFNKAEQSGRDAAGNLNNWSRQRRAKFNFCLAFYPSTSHWTKYIAQQGGSTSKENLLHCARFI